MASLLAEMAPEDSGPLKAKICQLMKKHAAEVIETIVKKKRKLLCKVLNMKNTTNMYLCESFDCVFLGSTGSLTEGMVIQGFVIVGRPIQHGLQHVQGLVVFVESHVASRHRHVVVIVLIEQRQRLSNNIIQIFIFLKGQAINSTNSCAVRCIEKRIKKPNK